MKRLQPYHLLIVLAALFIITGLAVFSLRFYSSTFKKGSPVEPKIQIDDNSLFELWFVNADIFDLSVDHNVTGILFGSSAKKVSLLDRERMLRWEKSFYTEPLQAKISACGNYLAVGTAGGNLFFMSTNQQVWWEKELLEPVYQVTMSANGKWVAAARGLPDQEEHTLELYSQSGDLIWGIDTGPVLKTYLVGEQADQGKIIFSQTQDESIVTTAVSLEGELLWSQEAVALAAISRTGNRLAAVQGGKMVISNYLGQPLWKTELPFNVEMVMFNPQNYNILAYGAGNGGIENFYYFSSEGNLLWMKRIADGSLFSFTADGRQIVTSSWMHYKDDFSQMLLFAENGVEVNRWEVAIRIEHLVVTGNRRYVVLGGEDGYIDVIDLETELSQGQDSVPALPFYNPVVVGSSGEQTGITLFFYDDSYLVPVTRAISPTKSRIRAAVEELIRGPARESSLYRTIPKDANIEVRFLEEKGQVYLDISSPELVQMAGSAQSIAALESLRYTLGRFPEVREIYLTVNNELIEIFGDGLALEQPLIPYRWRQPVFVPVRLGERYYLVPREARDLEIEQRDLEGLLQAVLRTYRAFYFIPGDLRLIGVEEKPEAVTINLNSSLRMIFPEKGGDEERLQAALLLDALFLTAYENSGAKKIDILVEGEPWVQPQDYPDLSRNFYQPYYLNPEP